MQHKIKNKINLFNKTTLSCLAFLIAAVGLFIACNGATFALQWKDKEEKVTTLAPGVVISDAIITTQANGRAIIMTVATGVNGMLNIIDEQQGKVIHSTPLASSGADLTVWGYAVLPNRNVVVSTSKAELFIINPDTFEIKKASSKPGGSNFFWEVAAGENGMVYVGTYPTGQVLGYDTVNDTWQDFGVVANGEMYVRSLVYDKYNGQGYLYAGTGTNDPAIWQINTSTKQKVKLPKPPGLDDDKKFVYTLSAHANYIYSLGTNDVFDVKNNKWSDVLDGSATGSNARTIKASKNGDSVYYLKKQDAQRNQIVRYEPATKTKTIVKSGIRNGRRLVESILLNEHDVLMMYHGGLLDIYDIKKNDAPRKMDNLVAGPRQVHSMGLGPDGKVYAGAYMPTILMAQIDPTVAIEGSAKLIKHQANQIEGFGKSGDWLLLGLYPKGAIASYNTKTNEYRKEVLIENNQQRPYALADIDGTLAAVGTVPNYGSLGGALTIYNVKNNKIEGVYRDSALVPGQAIISLVSKDGIVYAGTTISGGLGIKPTEKSAKVFSFDVATRKLKVSVVPIEGSAHISALTFGPNGNLYGIASNSIFEINPKTMKVVKTKTFSTAWGHRMGAMYYRDDKIYATMGGSNDAGIFEIDPVTFERKLLIKGGLNLVLSEKGHMYFSRGADIMRLSLIDPDPDVPDPGSDSDPDSGTSDLDIVSDDIQTTNNVGVPSTGSGGAMTNLPLVIAKMSFVLLAGLVSWRLCRVLASRKSCE